MNKQEGIELKVNMMQDRFKFRFWHKKRKKMYDVLHLHTKTWNNGGEWVTAKGFNIITQQDIHIPLELKDGLIMQSTGLRDKNGKLIFEKDIIKCSYGSEFAIGVIEWDSEELQFALKIEDNFYSIRQKSKFDIIENLGNIYENPELLEVNNG